MWKPRSNPYSYQGDAKALLVLMEASRQTGLCLLCHSAPIPEERFQGTLAPSLAGAGATDTGVAAIVLGGITVITRCFFFISGKPWSLPNWAQRGLQYAPIAALAAVVVPEIVMTHGALIGRELVVQQQRVGPVEGGFAHDGETSVAARPSAMKRARWWSSSPNWWSIMTRRLA